MPEILVDSGPGVFTDVAGFGGPYRPLRFEADVYDCEVVGRIPEELNGTYYNLGPDRHYPSLPGDIVINGDGLMKSFRFENGHVDYRCRFVMTERLKRERAARRRLYGGYRNPFTDDPSTAGTDRDNTANTYAWAHNGRLFALREDSPPYEIDPVTLETGEVFTAGGALRSAGMTAHPKLDPVTGEWWSFNFYAEKPRSYDGEMALQVLDRDGNLYRQERFKAPYGGLVHDFAVTREHVIFPVMPVTVDVDRMKAGGSFYAYDPRLDPVWGIMPRDGTVDDLRWFSVPRSFMAHVMNAYSEGGVVHVDAACSAASSFPFIPQIDGTFVDRALTVPNITRVTFDLRKKDDAVTMTPLPNAIGELPRVDDRFAMERYRYGWTSSLGGVLRVDWERNELMMHPLGIEGRPQEPIFVPRTPDGTEGDGFVLAILNRGPHADLAVIDARSAGEPLALVRLPFHQAVGFHGSFVQAS